MTTPKLTLITLGSAKALTRDLQEGIYLEMGVFPSRTAGA